MVLIIIFVHAVSADKVQIEQGGTEFSDRGVLGTKADFFTLSNLLFHKNDFLNWQIGSQISFYF